ncbi:MAG TPA: MOSC domain-containing protein, partial [Candidatus Tectomicrobia bacterium]
TQPTSETLAPLHIILPDGRTISAQDPDASAVLSSVLGREVILDCAQPNQHTRAEIDPLTVFGDVGVENVKPGMTVATMPDSFALPRGTFFDAAMIHVLASGTLSYMRRLIGADTQLDPRRLRPNIVVETDARAEGFIEDSWLEGTLELGGSVKIIAMRAALRCVMTTHGQADLARDPRILRAAAQYHQAHLGVFGAIGAPGKLHVGDPVILAM